MSIDLTKKFDESTIESLRELNEEKRLKALEFLGEKWILHPNNQVKRITKPKSGKKAKS